MCRTQVTTGHGAPATKRDIQAQPSCVPATALPRKTSEYQSKCNAPWPQLRRRSQHSPAPRYVLIEDFGWIAPIETHFYSWQPLLLPRSPHPALCITPPLPPGVTSYKVLAIVAFAEPAAPGDMDRLHKDAVEIVTSTGLRRIERDFCCQWKDARLLRSRSVCKPPL
jgi:hypothetical protein